MELKRLRVFKRSRPRILAKWSEVSAYCPQVIKQRSPRTNSVNVFFFFFLLVHSCPPAPPLCLSSLLSTFVALRGHRRRITDERIEFSTPPRLHIDFHTFPPPLPALPPGFACLVFCFVLSLPRLAWSDNRVAFARRLVLPFGRTGTIISHLRRKGLIHPALLETNKPMQCRK